MKLYVAKTIVPGHKLGKEFFSSKFVAVPDKLGIPVMVEHDGVVKEFSNKPTLKRTFEDKFGRGNYSMNYFKWE